MRKQRDAVVTGHSISTMEFNIVQTSEACCCHVHTIVMFHLNCSNTVLYELHCCLHLYRAVSIALLKIFTGAL